MRGALPSTAFWRAQRVFLTGHTGFKGGWLALWLRRMGAAVCGYALEPYTVPSLCDASGVRELVQSHDGDIRDLARMRAVFEAFDPTIVLHLAAQPLVRRSYAYPLETYSTNIMGVVNLLELARASSQVKATLIVTTDKCYDNLEQIWAYRETDRLGGRDPYSNSKACAEMVVAGYWWSYFAELDDQGLGSARAGNVFGGGDWSEDRLVPDLIKAFHDGRAGVLRRPESIRPWQHVLEPLCGYLLAAERLSLPSRRAVPPTWNFGPNAMDNLQVGAIAERLAKAWGKDARVDIRREGAGLHEATLLSLDHTKATQDLDWRPRWSLDVALPRTAEWYRAFYDGANMLEISNRQIDDYLVS